MKHIILIFSISILLFSCTNNKHNVNDETSFVQSEDSIIIDVRTPEEWQSDGHASCTVSLPLDELERGIDSLKKYKYIGVVCRSGNRAEQAKSILSANGIKQAVNLGSWQNVNCKNP